MLQPRHPAMPLGTFSTHTYTHKKKHFQMLFRLLDSPWLITVMMPQGQTSPVGLGPPIIKSSEIGCFWGAPDPSSVVYGLWGRRKQILHFQYPNNPLLKQQEIKVLLALQTSRRSFSVWHPLGEDIWMADSELSIQMFNYCGNSTLNGSQVGLAVVTVTQVSSFSWKCLFTSAVPPWIGQLCLEEPHDHRTYQINLLNYAFCSNLHHHRLAK